MTTPSITAAQIVAVAQAAIAVAIAFGLDLTAEQQNALLQLSSVLAASLGIGDAVIRNGRSRRK